MSVDDLAQYRVAVKAPISIEVNDYKTYTGPPPCSGAVYSLIINILEGKFKRALTLKGKIFY